MRKLVLVLVLVAAACLAAAAAASADNGPIQVSGQSADTSQQAVAASSATQTNPSNTNVSIRVLSPGNDGNVTQSNAAGSSAAAGNTATTGQSSSQTAAGGGIQSSQQTAGTDQLAIALSAAAQLNPSNASVPVRVQSPGGGGDVSQANTAGSTSTAGNTSATDQSGSQSQSGSSCGCDSSGTPIQTSDQSAATHQSSAALSKAEQIKPSNTNVAVRVLSPGDDGSVSQSNTAGSSAVAGNGATTTQQASQSEAAGNGIQIAGQDAKTAQGALAASAAHQLDASNDASPVRVDSAGNGGDVTQANTAGSSATAGNTAGTNQTGAQSNTGASCGCNGLGIQVLGQQSSTEQAAIALSAAVQQFGERSSCGCDGSSAGNKADPVRVDSPGSDGSVTQANTVGSAATAGNAASTKQDGAQWEAGGGLQIQALGQQAWTGQLAAAASFAAQLAPSNDASPVRVKSPDGGGTVLSNPVSQSNTAGSRGTGGNDAATMQNGRQSIGAMPETAQALPGNRTSGGEGVKQNN